MCDCLSKNPPSFALAGILRNTILKIQFKKPSLPWYWTRSLSIIMNHDSGS